jgi:hypothetical protein
MSLAVSQKARAIETNYRGYRFRSRTETRWAVFFDAAGIAWQYEAEGYNLGGRYYLPDFFLPELKVFVEVKPAKEATEQAAPLLRALAEASGCRTLFAIGAPGVDNDKPFLECSNFANEVWRPAIGQCPFCNRIAFGFSPSISCRCVGNIRLLKAPFCKPLRLQHALSEAQRARFEHGEDGRPQPYIPPPPPSQIGVYLAGAIFKETDPTKELGDIVDAWRANIFGCETEELELGTAVGRFIYGGPTISYEHGQATEGLAFNCLDEVAAADVLFAWIDGYETIGTLAEIGAAYALGTDLYRLRSRGPFQAFLLCEAIGHCRRHRRRRDCGVGAFCAVAVERRGHAANGGAAMNAFLELADRQIAAPVKARQRAVQKRAAREAERKAIIERDRLRGEWQRWRRGRRETLLAGPHAVAAQALFDFLGAMALADGAALIAPIERGPWRDADGDARFEILSLVDDHIIALRERHDLPPFDDPLDDPLDDSSSVFLAVRGLLS